LKELETYLNRARNQGLNFVRHNIAAREADIPKKHVLSVFSVLCDEGILEAKIKITCPNCASSHGGVYSRQSDVPEQTKSCFCGEEFRMGERSNWEVVYELPDGEVDFFRSFDESLKIFSEEAYSVSTEYIERKYEQLKSMDNPSYRGQLFDHFVGILFLQIEGVHAISRYPHADSGEIDVYINLASAPDYLSRTIGCASLVENKWENKPAKLGYYNKFQPKVEEVDKRHGTNIAFFISMNGFKSTVEEKLNQSENPRTIGLTREDIEIMIDEGTAEPILRRESFP
jgi:hypothetical protein